MGAGAAALIRHYPPIPLSFPASTTSGVLVGGPAYLMGWGLLETTGAAAATIELFDGEDATGQLIVPIALSSGQSTRDWNSPEGIYCSRGIFFRLLTGSVRGVIWVRLRRGPSPVSRA